MALDPQARTDELAAQLRRYTQIAVLLLLATLAVSLTLARRLQRRIAEPIQRLAASTAPTGCCGARTEAVSGDG